MFLRKFVKFKSNLEMKLDFSQDGYHTHACQQDPYRMGGNSMRPWVG